MTVSFSIEALAGQLIDNTSGATHWYRCSYELSLWCGVCLIHENQLKQEFALRSGVQLSWNALVFGGNITYVRTYLCVIRTLVGFLDLESKTLPGNRIFYLEPLENKFSSMMNYQIDVAETITQFSNFPWHRLECLLKFRSVCSFLRAAALALRPSILRSGRENPSLNYLKKIPWRNKATIFWCVGCEWMVVSHQAHQQ